MYTLTAIRGFRTFRFQNRHLPALIAQAGEYDTANIADVDGREVYAVAFEPMLLRPQAS